MCYDALSHERKIEDLISLKCYSASTSKSFRLFQKAFCLGH
jgi:hypothetical protein